MNVGERSVLLRQEAVSALIKKKTKSVDLIVTSPPFLPKDVGGAEIFDDAGYLVWLADAVAEMRRVARVVLMLHSSRRIVDIIQEVAAPRRMLIWDKMVGMGAYRYEPIFVYADKDERLDGAGRIWNDAIRVTPIVGAAQVVPYQNPVRLYYTLLRYFPDLVTVLDPFAGAGTTIVAGEYLDKQVEGWEYKAETFRKAERYIKMMLDRSVKREWLHALANKERQEEWTGELWRDRDRKQGAITR